MKDLNAIVVGGTGQFGLTIAKLLLQKKYKVIITTRSLIKKKEIIKNYKKIKFLKLNIYSKFEIEKLIKKFNPKIIFYLAGQSSPKKSFTKKKETLKSNVIGCKNILEILKKEKSKCKFLNATSSEMFGRVKGKIKLTSLKKPYSPYGQAKLKSFNITKKFRVDHNLRTFNAIIFNTESFLRNKEFLIPKICIAAINANKDQKKTAFGDIDIIREWNWCEEQSKYLIKFLQKKPQDFILSNGKYYSARQMLKFAFDYFNLNYKKYIYLDKNFFRENEIKNKISDYKACLKRNKMRRKSKIFGKKIINTMIKNYLYGKKN